MKKQSDSWYKNKTWNGAIDSVFEKNLRYERNDMHKATYLQEQGCLLLQNSSEKIQEVGLVLLSRLLDDYATAWDQILTAQEKLGDYYFKKNQYKRAASYFKMVTEYCVQQQSRTNTSNMADLKWTEALYKTNEPDALPVAAELLRLYPVVLLKTAEQKNYYNQLQLHINTAMENTAARQGNSNL